MCISMCVYVYMCICVYVYMCVQKKMQANKYTKIHQEKELEWTEETLFYLIYWVLGCSL